MTDEDRSGEAESSVGLFDVDSIGRDVEKITHRIVEYTYRGYIVYVRLDYNHLAVPVVRTAVAPPESSGRPYDSRTVETAVCEGRIRDSLRAMLGDRSDTDLIIERAIEKTEAFVDRHIEARTDLFDSVRRHTGSEQGEGVNE